MHTRKQTQNAKSKSKNEANINKGSKNKKQTSKDSVLKNKIQSRELTLGKGNKSRGDKPSQWGVGRGEREGRWGGVGRCSVFGCSERRGDEQKRVITSIDDW